MTTRAAQFELLADPLTDPTTGALCSGYSVEFYSAGTSNPKNVWTEKEKTNPFTTYNLDSGGKALLYGDGIYKIVVKNIDGAVVLSLDNQKIQATTFSVRTMTGAGTVTPDDDVIICNGTFTITIGSATYPAPSSFEHPLTFINSGSGAITLDPYSTVNIDSSATYPLSAGDETVIIPDGAGNVWRSSLQTAISSRTELTTPANDDALLIEDASATGDKNRYIKTKNFLKVSYLSGYADFATAVTAIGATNTKLVIDTTGAVDTNTTIPETLNLCWYKTGCALTVATTKTLTINGMIEAGLYQIFALTGSGAVSFGHRIGDAYPQWFGAKGDGATTDNLSAIQATLAAIPTGGKVVISPSSGYYKIVNTGGLSACIQITKRCTLQIDGDLQSTKAAAIEANPAYIFNVTGADVTITGFGKLSGSGSIDDTNAGNQTTSPGLIHVTGDNFILSGLTIATPPKIGVSLNACDHARIEKCTFTGGPTTYTALHTAYFAIRANGGVGHTIVNNRFIPDGTGGNFVNAIFFDLVNDSIISNNYCKDNWEKFSYLYGDGNLVENNIVIDCQLTSFFRFHGSRNKCLGNQCRGAQGGCVIYDGYGNEVIGNAFHGLTQTGIIVQKSAAGYSDGFSETQISDNTITAATGTQSNGIRVFVDDLTSSMIEITGNFIYGFCEATTEGLIKVDAAATDTVTDVLISDNTLGSGVNGIYLERVTDSIISNNIIKATTGYGIKSIGSARNQVSDNFLNSPGAYAFYESSSSVIRYFHNQIRGASNSGITGAGANSYEIGNQYDDTELKSAHIADSADATVNAILAALEKYGILKTA